MMNGLPEESVDVIFADPPYNMRLGAPLLRPDRSSVPTVNDHWDKFTTTDAYDSFTTEWLTACKRVLKEHGTIWVIGSYHNIYRVGAKLMDVGFWILNDVIWIKANPTPHMRGVRFCNAHETLLWAKKDTNIGTHTFNYHELKSGNEDVQMRSDWYIPLCSGGERVKWEGEKAHSTQKPEALLRRVINSSTRRGDIVLDPFCGSGTTAAVARKLGRHFITIDREPMYVSIATERLAAVVPEENDSSQLSVHSAPRARVKFMSLVETGVLKAGTKLYFRGRKHFAVVNGDGTISSGRVRGSIHKVGCLVTGATSCNGWTEWFFRDGPNIGLPLDSLREPRPSDSL